MKILIGTTNPAKLKYYSNLLVKYDVECYSLTDFNIVDDVEELGKSPVENSEIKAKYYGKYFDTVICNDAGLYIEGLDFEDERQPGLKVRTPHGSKKRLDDEEMIDYYSNLINSLGGKQYCYYLDGISIFNGGEIYNYQTPKEKARGFYMVGKPSKIRRKGWPLDSLSLNLDGTSYFVDSDNPIKQNNQIFDKDITKFIVESLNLQLKE